MSSHNYTKDVNAERLRQEIENSNISVAWDKTAIVGSSVIISFKGDLSVAEIAILDDIVANHVNTPLDSSAPQLVKIQEEENPTGGHFATRGFLMDIPAVVGVETMDIEFDTNINLLSAEWTDKAENTGDCVGMEVSPGAVIGTIQADVLASDTAIKVSSTVIANAFVGAHIGITDGVNSDDLGQCLAVDSVNNEITVKTGPSNGYAVGTPTYINMTLKVAEGICLAEGTRHQLGDSKIGGSYIPANTVLRAKYDNKDGVAKKFRFTLEYLY